MITKNTTLISILLFLYVFFSNQIYSANRYWIGGTGTWDISSTSNWSTSSGGASGASVPTSSDNVFFDANSFSGGGQIVTISATVNCLSMSWTGATNTPTLAGSSTLNIYGNLTLIAGMTITYTGTIEFESTSTGRTITTAGKSLASNLNFQGTGGAWTMQDALTTTKEFELTAGTFNTGNYTLAVRQLNCYGFSSTTRALNLGSSTVNITPGSVWTSDILNFDGSNLTVNAGTSSINITLSSSATFSYDIDYNGKTLYDLTLSNTNVAIITSGSATFNNLTLGAGNIYQISSGTTHTIQNTLTATGTCTSYIYIRSSSSGTLATMAFSGGVQSSSNLIVQDITASTNTNTCTDCIDLVATDGTWSWVTARTARDLYWIGNTGNYSDPTEWSTTSGGGNDVTCSPSPIDNVYFDANSFSSGGSTVSINRQYVFCKNMDWTGVTNSPTFSGSFVNLTIAGTLTYSSSMTLSNYVTHYFQSSTNPTEITTNGQGLYTTYFQSGGYYTLEDDLDVNGSINISSSTTLDVLPNGGVIGTDEKNINLGGSWSNYGTFIERSNNNAWVIFDGTSSSYLWTSETFNNLEINGAGGTLQTYSDNHTVTNELLVTLGTLNINPSSTRTLTCSNISKIDGGKLYLSTSGARLSLANDLDINGGTFEMDLGESTVTDNIDSDGGIIQMDGGTLTVNGSGGTDGISLANAGELELNGGTVTVGNGTTEDLTVEGGVLDMNSGTLNTKGYISMTSGTFDCNDGTINISTASTTGTQLNFTGGTYTLTGGTVDIQNFDSGGASNCINIAAGTTLGTITGGTIKTSATNANALINIDASRKIFNLELASTGRTITLADALDMDGSFTLTSGTLTTGGLAMSVGETWTFTAGTFTPASNTVTFDGSANQSIAGASTTTFYNLTNSNTSTGITLNKNIVVTNTLAMSGAAADIDLNGNNIDLSSTGTISGESNSDRIYGTSGIITTTRDIGTPTTLNVGGMGATITSATNMGNTTIYRSHVPQTGLGNTGIERFYSISPTTNTGIDATLTINYFDDEIAGHTESDLVLYRSTDGGTTWTSRGGTVNTGANSITLSGIDAFSLWTPSDEIAQPLPVNLISFEVEKSGKNNKLIWSTASEKNAGFYLVEKTTDGNHFELINHTIANGNTLFKSTYSTEDKNVEPIINYYRLTQVDLDNRRTSFPLISVDNSGNNNDKEVVSITNLLGQQIETSYVGIILIKYSDGSSKKTFQYGNL